jgi:pimeloyl-ACP methyl ester carboxylesterase
LKDYSLEPRVSDLQAVVDTLKLKRFALYGLSSGGPAAIAYAARHPERVTRVVLSGTCAGGPTSFTPVEQRRVGALFSLWETSWDNPAFLNMLASLLMPNPTVVQKRVFADFTCRSGSPEDLRAFLAAPGKLDVTALVPLIKAPALVLKVRDDEIVPSDCAIHLASLIPGARLVMIEGKDHIPVPGDGEREQFAQALEPFLDQDIRPASASTRD